MKELKLYIRIFASKPKLQLKVFQKELLYYKLFQDNGRFLLFDFFFIGLMHSALQTFLFIIIFNISVFSVLLYPGTLILENTLFI